MRVVHAVCISGLTGLLAACGSLQPQPAATQVIPSSEAALSSSDLLYVSDQHTGDVYVYSYPDDRLISTLTGFNGDPEGLCADHAGNVFVTVQSGSIIEYAHGGTKPIKTLLDKYYPLACSVDPTTGNLAVANESGNVSIYPATGPPTLYDTKLIPEFCAYDPSGNLFVDSSGAPGVRIEELPKGGNTFQSFNYGGRNNGTPAGLQWVHRHLAVGDASPYQRKCCGRIFRLSVNGEQGKRVATTHIRGEILNFFVERSAAIVTTYTHDVVIYDYPSGRLASTIKEPGENSFGVVVSP